MGLDPTEIPSPGPSQGGHPQPPPPLSKGLRGALPAITMAPPVSIYLIHNFREGFQGLHFVGGVRFPQGPPSRPQQHGTLWAVPFRRIRTNTRPPLLAMVGRAPVAIPSSSALCTATRVLPLARAPPSGSDDSGGTMSYKAQEMSPSAQKATSNSEGSCVLTRAQRKACSMSSHFCFKR